MRIVTIALSFCVFFDMIHWRKLFLPALSFQKTCQSATEVQQRADKLIKDGHFDPDAIWNCAENMSRRWQHLMSKSEERRKVVMVSYSFFKSAEQVIARASWFTGGLRTKVQLVNTAFQTECACFRLSRVMRIPCAWLSLEEERDPSVCRTGIREFYHVKVAIQSVLVVRSVGRLVSQFVGPSCAQLFCPSVRRLVSPLFGLSFLLSVCPPIHMCTRRLPRGMD